MIYILDALDNYDSEIVFVDLYNIYSTVEKIDGKMEFLKWKKLSWDLDLIK